MEAERRLIRPNHGKVVSQDLHVGSGLGRNHRPEDLRAEWEDAVIRVPVADDDGTAGIPGQFPGAFLRPVDQPELWNAGIN